MPNVQNTFISPTQQSASDFVRAALRLVGAIGSGEEETLSNSELTDGAMILNQMLDAWSIDRLTIFTIQRTTVDSNNAILTLTPTIQTYQIGPGAPLAGATGFNMPRPPRIERVSIINQAGSGNPNELYMDMYNDVEWQSIPNKNTLGPLPQKVWNDLGYPFLTLSYWPIPNIALPTVFYIWAALTQFSDLAVKMAFPPGYSEAIKYNLALRLAAEFPGDMSKLPIVKALAVESLDRVMNFNAPPKVLRMDAGLATVQGPGLGNIYTDQPWSRSQN